MQDVRGLPIYEVLDEIRDRTGMYVGSKCILRLSSWLSGFFWAEHKHGFSPAGEQPDFGGFHDWVAQHYGWTESTAGWANIILRESDEDTAAAVDTFFALLDEYRAGDASSK